MIRDFVEEKGSAVPADLLLEGTNRHTNKGQQGLRNRHCRRLTPTLCHHRHPPNDFHEQLLAMNRTAHSVQNVPRIRTPRTFLTSGLLPHPSPPESSRRTIY